MIRTGPVRDKEGGRMNLKNFVDILNLREEKEIKPWRPHKKIVTREEVMEIFGEVPDYTVRYGLAVLVTPLSDGRFRVTVADAV